jgi:hypothetical protein
MQGVCGTDYNPELRKKALEVAKQEQLLHAVRAQQVEVVERLRDPWRTPLSGRDNSLELAKACSISAWLVDWEIRRALPAILYKYRDRMSEEVKVQYEKLRRAEEERKKQADAPTQRSSKKKPAMGHADKNQPWPSQEENDQEDWLNQLSKDPMIDDPGGLYFGVAPLWLKALMTDKSPLEGKIQRTVRLDQEDV